MHTEHNHPSFMIIGAAKAGTTSLQAYLQRHPSLFMSKLKEPEFFSRKEIWEKGFDWYNNLFASAPEGSMCGEASTTYTRWPHTLDSAKLIHNHTNIRRFIYIMRHPAERAFSHYRHHMRSGVTRSFEQALMDDEIYFDCGNYMMQIERYLDYFERKNILFIFSDHLRNNPRETLFRIQDFLDVPKVDLVQSGAIVKNTNKDDHYLRSRTTQRLRKIPAMSFLIDQFPAYWRKKTFELIQDSSFGTRIRSQHEVPPLSIATRQFLNKRYSEPNRKLSIFLQEDLSSWAI